MGLKSRNILGISVTTESKETILEYIKKYLEEAISDKRKVIRIVTPNPEQIVYAQNDSHFAEILNQADVAIPDGIGLALVMRRKRIPGVEFMEDLVRLAAKRGYPIGLIGGRGGVAVAALECLKRRYPGLVGWAEDGPTMQMENGELKMENVQGVDRIVQTKPWVVFVGFGAPKQEYFIEYVQKQLPITHYPLPIILMSVGGAFDMIAGKTLRAPLALRALGLEWLWRLGQEPWRWKRQLALFKFLWFVAWR